MQPAGFQFPKRSFLARTLTRCAAFTLLLGPVVANAEEGSIVQATRVQIENTSASDVSSESPQLLNVPETLTSGLAGDAIEQELRFHLAIAKSLRGDFDQAMHLLDTPQADDPASKFAVAVCMLQKGDVEEGVELLEEIRSRDDAPVESSKYLAVGYLHLGRAAESQEAAEQYLREVEADAYTHYLRGIAMIHQDQPQQASDALKRAGYDDSEVAKIQQVVMQAPVDVAQRRSTIPGTLSVVSGQTFDGSAGRRVADKPYNLTILFAGEYDSNVPLQPEFVGLGSDIDYEDYRFLIASFLDVELLSSELFNIGLVGSTYNTFQFDANEFNIQDYMGGMYLNGLLLERLMGSCRYEYHHTLVDQRRFADDHRLTPSLTLLGDRGHTTVFYEFNPVDADAPALIPAQFQSGDTHRIGVTQAIYTFGGDGRVYAGYQFADTAADGSDFDRTAHYVTGRIERPLCWNMIADVDVRYVWEDYDNPNSLDFYERPRDDNRLELRLGLQKNFVRPVSLRLDYTYFDNNSNTENLFGVPFYEYDRHIFSTQLIFTL